MERPSPDELISAYFDGEATPEERALVERLLADPKHRQTLEEYGQLRDELRSMPAPRLSPAWSARLRDKLAEAKPAWAKGAGTASSNREASPVASAPPFSTDGKVQAPPVVPVATLPPRGEGPSRFRQFWLAAGVGVAAGTLGIFIGWSAQTLRPEGVDLDIAFGPSSSQSPAPEPMAATTSEPMPMSATPPENFAISEAEESAEIAKADAADEKSQDFRQSFSESLPQSALEAQATDSPADSAELAGAAASYGGAVGKMTSGEANGERLAELAQTEFKKEEAPAFTGGAPSVQMGVPASGSGPWNEYADGVAVDGAPTEYFATYVGVWEPTGIRLYGMATREAHLQRQEAGKDDRFAARDKQAEERTPLSSLSLEGTPEKVAEALEILSRAESGGRVRLLARFDDDGQTRSWRAQGLDRWAASEGELAAEAESRLEDETLERAEKIEGDVSNGLADDVTVDDLAAAQTASAIDRIEAFYYRSRTAKDRELADAIVAGADAFGALGYREGAVPDAGGFGPGVGGVAPGGSGLGGGGFGGGAFGGAAGASRTARSEMDAARAFAAPATDDSRGNLADPSNGASGGRAPAGAPSASRPAPGEIPPPPAPAPSIAFAENAPALPMPESATPPANEPASRARNVAPSQNGDGAAEGLAPPAPAVAAGPARPEPATAAPADVAPAAEAGATRRVKSNDESADIPDAARPMALAQGAPESPAADPAAAEQPALDAAAGDLASLSLQEQDQATFERKLLEEVRGLSLHAGNMWHAEDFSGPAPQRVRVILFAPEALAREEAELAMPAAEPAGPSTSPAGPAAAPAQPAADATPAEAVPAEPASAPDR